MSVSRPRSYVLNLIVLIYLSSVPLSVNSQYNKGCDLALASFYVWRGTDLTYIARLFSIPTRQEIMDYNNRASIPNENSVIAGTRINIPFRCDDLDDVGFLGHVFQYEVKSRDPYSRVVSNYSDLTNVDMLRRFNSRYNDNNIPNGVNLSVVVNCSCGDGDVSEDYGLFVTYPLRAEENLTYVESTMNVSAELIRRYNPGMDAKFRAGQGIIYIPGRDKNGNFPPLPTSTGLSGGAKAGIAIGVIGVVLLLAGLVYVGCYRNKAQKVLLLASEDHFRQSGRGRC